MEEEVRLAKELIKEKERKLGETEASLESRDKEIQDFFDNDYKELEEKNTRIEKEKKEVED